MKKLTIYKGVTVMMVLVMLIPSGCVSVKKVEITPQPDKNTEKDISEFTSVNKIPEGSMKMSKALSIISENDYVKKAFFKDKYINPKFDILNNKYSGNFNLLLLEESDYSVVYELISEETTTSIFLYLGKDNLNVTEKVDPNPGYKATVNSYFYDDTEKSESWINLNEDKKGNTLSETHSMHQSLPDVVPTINYEVNAVTISSMMKIDEYVFLDIYDVKTIYNDAKFEMGYHIDYNGESSELEKEAYENLIFLIQENEKYGIEHMLLMLEPYLKKIFKQKQKSL